MCGKIFSEFSHKIIISIILSKLFTDNLLLFVFGKWLVTSILPLLLQKMSLNKGHNIASILLIVLLESAFLTGYHASPTKFVDSFGTPTDNNLHVSLEK